MSKFVLKRLAKVEKKLALRALDIEEAKRVADLESLLQLYDYLRKQEQMSTPLEEIRKKDEETSKQSVEWYQAYLELSSEEQKRQNEISDLELAKDLEQFRVWLNSVERRQFDRKYADYKRRLDPSSAGETA